MNNLASNLYSGAATVGKVGTFMGAISSTILGIILLIIGVSMLTLIKNPQTSNTSGKLSGISCSTGDDCETDKNGVRSCTAETTCSGTATYIVNNKPYIIGYSGGQSSNGETVTVHYDPKNPRDATTDAPFPKWIGWIFIAFAMLLFSSWIAVYFTNKSKTFAAFEGASIAATALSSDIHA